LPNREIKDLNEYKLTFTVIIEEHDDPAVRKRARVIEDALGEVLSGAEVKVQ